MKRSLECTTSEATDSANVTDGDDPSFTQVKKKEKRGSAGVGSQALQSAKKSGAAPMMKPCVLCF